MPTHASDIPAGTLKTTVYWPESLKADLEALARQDGRRLNNYIVKVLADHVKAQTDGKRKSS